MDVAALGSERKLRLGVYFWFRLFNVAPETTARFSNLDDQCRDQSPPRVHRSGDALQCSGLLARAKWRDQPNFSILRTTRAISRSASRLAISCRRSCNLRPRATAISTFARPSLKYNLSGIRVSG